MTTYPKFGSMTNPSKDLVKEIADVKRHGFDFAEICIEPPTTIEVINSKKNEILAQLKKFKEPPIGHTSWWLDFGTEYNHIRKATVEELKEAIEISSKIGIELLNIHFNTWGLYDGIKTKIILNNYIASLKECVNYAKPLGVNIMLENIDISKEATSFKSFKYVVDHVTGLYIHLDIAHAFLTGGMSGVKSFITTFDKRIVHIHIHDNHGNSDEHLGLGEGKIKFSAVIRELKKINYDKTITFEVFRKLSRGKNISVDRSYVNRSKKYLKNLWDKL